MTNKPKTDPSEEDDGRVIADMNIDGFRWYRKDLGKKPVEFSKKERRAMFLAGLQTVLTVVAFVSVVMVIVYALVWLWLN